MSQDLQHRRTSSSSSTSTPHFPKINHGPYIQWDLIIGNDERILDLCGRSLETLFKLPFRTDLQFAILSKNRIFSIANLGVPRFLRVLDVSDNNIDLLPSSDFWSQLHHLQVSLVQFFILVCWNQSKEQSTISRTSF